MQSCSILCDSMDCSMPGAFTISQSVFKLMPLESVIPSNHFVLCRPLLLPSVFLSIRDFSNVLALHIRWPKYWSFSFRISPSNEYSGLISFRIDWFDLLAVQGTLKPHTIYTCLIELNSLQPIAYVFADSPRPSGSGHSLQCAKPGSPST